MHVNAIALGGFPIDMTTWTMQDHGNLIVNGIPMRRIGKDYELKRRGGRYAICSLCIGGSQGPTAIFERLS